MLSEMVILLMGFTRSLLLSRVEQIFGRVGVIRSWLTMSLSVLGVFSEEKTQPEATGPLKMLLLRVLGL